MALRKETPDRIELYRKLLVVFAGVAVLLPALMKITSFWMPLAAAILVILPLRLYEHRVVRVLVRTYVILLAALMPIVCIVVAVLGNFQTEYFSLLFLSAVPLPAAAAAAVQDKRWDIVQLRVLAFLHIVETALIIAYVVKVADWFKSVVFGCTALVILILALIIHPMKVPFANLIEKKLNTRPKE